MDNTATEFIGRGVDNTATASIETEKRKPASYHIGAVSKLTGISTHAIRVWERRYDAVTPQRSPGGTRIYSEADITRLRVLKKLTKQGHAIGTIAGLPLSQLHPLLSPGADSEREDTRARKAVTEFVAAISVFDLAAAENALVQASGLLDPLSFVFDVVAPSLQRLGDGWSGGELRVAHEHAATSLLRSFLGTFMRGRSLPYHVPTAIATTLSEELHEFGALMAAFVAKVRGWRVVYLGPNMPADDILHVIGQTEASLLMLSLINVRTDNTAAQLQALLSRMSSKVKLLAGGRSVWSYTDLLREDQCITDHTKFDQTLRHLRIELQSALT